MLACLPAALLSFLPGVSILYHEHDSPLETSVQTRPGAFLRFCLWARRVCARRAKVCVLPNRQRAQHFERSLKPVRPAEVVWNCPRRSEIGPPRAAAKPGELKLLYHGSIAPERPPKTAIEALAMLPQGVSLTAVGYETVGSRGYLDELRQLAERCGVSDRVHLRPAISRCELMRICGDFDLGLALLPRRSADLNFQAMTGASNKPFDYLANGLALLVSDLPDWRAMFVEPGYALSCDPGDPASIAAAVRRLLDHPEEMRRMGERGRRRIQSEWNYESQFQRVFHQMEGLAADAATAAQAAAHGVAGERRNA
jgi:glycosyltransferase involved in cell wall biosynthesis